VRGRPRATLDRSCRPRRCWAGEARAVRPGPLVPEPLGARSRMSSPDGARRAARALASACSWASAYASAWALRSVSACSLASTSAVTSVSALPWLWRSGARRACWLAMACPRSRPPQASSEAHSLPGPLSHRRPAGRARDAISSRGWMAWAVCVGSPGRRSLAAGQQGGFTGRVGRDPCTDRAARCHGGKPRRNQGHDGWDQRHALPSVGTRTKGCHADRSKSGAAKTHCRAGWSLVYHKQRKTQREGELAFGQPFSQTRAADAWKRRFAFSAKNRIIGRSPVSGHQLDGEIGASPMLWRNCDPTAQVVGKPEDRSLRVLRSTRHSASAGVLAGALVC